MTRQEVHIAIDWAAKEGWNPGLFDAECFYQTDTGGFLVGLLNDEPIATISAVKYGKSFGFLGFYLVKPEFRGMGYGIRIWNAGMAALNGRTIGLDGVVAQQENYKKSGFILAYRNVRYQGIGAGHALADSAIVPLSTCAFTEICAFDRPFFPEDRKDFLACWISQPQSTALALIVNHKLVGYGVLRACRNGYKIGPLFADSPEYAERLFLAFKAHIPEGQPFFMDIPMVNSAAVDLMNKHDMTISFETARMYRGQSPNLPISRLFGVTTFELG